MVGDNFKLAKHVTDQKEHTTANLSFARAVIHLKSLPLPKDEIVGASPNLVFTNFIYTIRFARSRIQSKGWTYIVASDLDRGYSIRFKTIDDLCKMAKEKPAVQWLLDNTNLGDVEMLNYVKEKVPMIFPLRFDMMEYLKKLQRQVQENPELGEADFLPQYCRNLNQAVMAESEELWEIKQNDFRNKRRSKNKEEQSK